MSRFNDSLALLQQLPYRDLYIILSIILLCVFAASKVIFPKLFVESITWDKLFGFRVKEDLGSTIRPFSAEHIYFTALFGFNLSFVLLFITNALDPDQVAIKILEVTGLGQGILLWLIVGLVLNLTFYLKYLFLVAIGWLFHMRQVISRHFIDYINASSLFYILVALCLAMSTYATFITGESFLKIVLITIVSFLFYRTALLYIKLIQLSPYSKLFIFSYICTTELIPLFIGLHFVTK